jgi:Protein of unknown function (DUF1579)
MTRCIFLAVVIGMVSAVWAEDSKPAAMDPQAMAKAMEEFAKPSPELAKLEPLAGSFTYTSKMWMDPNQPAMEGNGTVDRKWILGNRFLEEEVKGTGMVPGQEFESRGVTGYDKNEKKFTMGWICNMGTNITTSQGTVDATGKVFTFQCEQMCPIRNRMIKERDVLKIESNDKHVLEMYQTDKGQEMKVMELVATRKK